MLHILCATLIGLLYGDSGSNASKSFENVGFLLIGIVYLWYTTVMPGVLKCKLTLALFVCSKKPFGLDLIFIFVIKKYFRFFSVCVLYDNFPVPTELEIVRKETFNNWYKARTYFLANTLTTTPIHVNRLKLY